MATLALHHVGVRRDGRMLLHDVDLRVDDGELVGVVGASGAGKTTLLRVIAGLEEVTVGSIEIDGVDVTRSPSRDRDVAMVFQTPALIPNRDVRSNVAFPLEMRGAGAEEIRLRVDAESRALHIEALLHRSPEELSAGEAQLVQIARALVRVPRVLLLDEPLARLDAALRQHTRHELQLLQRGYGVTTVFTTNDPVEAMTLADRLVVLDRGVVVQVGPPLEVFHEPATVEAARFTGDVDVVTVRVERADDGFDLVRTGLRHRVWRPALAALAGREVGLLTRPGWWSIDDRGPVGAVVESVSPYGTAHHLVCRIGDARIGVLDPQTRHHPGDAITLRLDQWVLVDEVDGRRID